MTKHVWYLVFAIAMIPSVVFAARGGWSSGGGGLMKDSRNPWFISDGVAVTYCIRLDARNFGADITLARQQITRALQFWRAEFSNAVLPNLPKFGPSRIANQKFIESSCEAEPDLVFQLGILSENQKDNFREWSDYGAIAIRTSYDPKALRGKGFIYVAPVSGPMAVRLKGVPQNVWTKNGGRALFLTLVHELGHVFGLPHGGSFGDLMSEGFVENLLVNPDETLEGEIHYFSLPSGSKAICPAESVLKVWINFFQAGGEARCFRFKFEHELNSQLFGATTFRVFSSESRDGRFFEVGSGSLRLTRFNPILVNILWLPPEQSVFATEDVLHIGVPAVLGASLMRVTKQGRVRLKTGTKSLSLELEQGRHGVSLMGVDRAGEFVPLL